MIWHENGPSLEAINKSGINTMVEHCQIQIISKTDDELVGTMEVSDKIKQPFGIVHGGANCVLAETLGSFAANLTCDMTKFHAVGLQISTSHVKAVRRGVITGIAKPTHLGRTIQVWEIKTYNDQQQLTSNTSLTLSILKKLKES